MKPLIPAFSVVFVGVFVSVFAILTASPSHADIIRDCEESLQRAQSDLQKAADDFNTGVGTGTDVATAELELLNVRLQCGNVEKAEYCQQAPIFAEKRLNGTLEESRVGQRSAADIRAAKRALKAVSTLCH